ncbi:MAG: hypothetical protein L0Y32_06035 [Nevskiales bacterium]|nr:hypothetical protein [Nevskiales bacterium]
MNDSCPKCGKHTVLPGRCLSVQGDRAFQFEPEGLKWFRWALLHGVKLQQAFTACSSCGFVWSTVSGEELRRYVETHRKKMMDAEGSVVAQAGH